MSKDYYENTQRNQTHNHIVIEVENYFVFLSKRYTRGTFYATGINSAFTKTVHKLYLTTLSAKALQLEFKKV